MFVVTNIQSSPKVLKTIYIMQWLKFEFEHATLQFTL